MEKNIATETMVGERGYRRREKDRQDNVTGMEYTQEGDIIQGSDGMTKPQITCFRYEKGYISLTSVWTSKREKNR